MSFFNNFVIWLEIFRSNRLKQNLFNPLQGFVKKAFFLILLILFLSLPSLLNAQTKRIYIANDDHTDYMWSADEATYKTAFLGMIDYYLDLADAHIQETPEYQSRFNPDGSFWMWTYEKNKPASDFERLINRIRSGHISIPLTALVSTYGGQPTEAVLRGMYYSGQIERRFNLRFSLAMTKENQTLPYGLGSLWAGAGAKYSWMGICGCASKVPDAWDREHDIYYWVGPDGSRLLMKWNSMLKGNQGIGGYAEAFDPFGVVDYVDTNSAFTSRYPYSIIGAFGRGWDNLSTFTDQFIAAAKQKTNENRQVIVSNEEDFFKDFELTYGTSLPEVSASFGNEWDLYCASMAEVTAGVKRSVEKLRSAEALATLVSLKDSSFMNGHTQARDLAWMDLGLYWEHDWTADGNVSKTARRDWQRRIAGEIGSYVDDLFADASARLGSLIQKTGTNPRFFIFNPLSWTRSDFADLRYSDTNPFHVIDLSTGQETPSQIEVLDGERLLRIYAPDIPPLGYKVFEVVSGAGANFPAAADVSGNTIQNGFYGLTVADRGAITSLIDKRRGNREFSKDINGRMINDLGQASGVLQVENAGPVSVTLKADSSGPLNHTTRITLFRGSDRIDIRNDINQNFSDTFTWGFGFNLANPDIWHEELGAVIRAKLLSQGGHYSPRNARYDWLTLNHFADINDGSVGVTLSNADTSFMKHGSSGISTLDVNTPQISPLAGGQVDSPLGIPNQGGDTHFLQRFALRTHDAFSSIEAMRFALEHQNPLVTGVITGGGMYPETSFSLVTVSNPNALIWALKPAEDGIDQGIIVRIWNLSGNPESFSLSLVDGISSAQRTTHIETPLESATVTGGSLYDSIAARQIRTYLLSMKNGSNEPPFINVHPTNQNVTVGQTASFSVTAAGTAPLSYQWQRLSGTWGNISGATSAIYTTPATALSDNGAQFRCVVSNLYGTATSFEATLTVQELPPSITTQPANQSVTIGQTATFRVAATGTPTPSYQWQKQPSGGAFANITGATGTSYTTPATTMGDNNAQFRCVVSNTAGTVNSNAAVLTVNAAPVAVAPSITSQPANQTATVGQTATFSVVASGTAPLSYRWQRRLSGTWWNISRATSATYTTSATTLGDNNAQFRCVVSNTAGTASSNAAVLTVSATSVAPRITEVGSFSNLKHCAAFYFDLHASQSIHN
jgi:alpha-mannosidase